MKGPNQNLVIPSTFIGFGLLMLYGLLPVLDYNGDSARYLGLADSLLAGKGYFFNFRPHTRFPPMFPLLLKELIALFGNSVIFIHGFIAACSLVGAMLSYVILKKMRTSLSDSKWFAPSAILLFLSSPFVYERATGHVASDFPFFVCSALFLLLWQQLSKSEKYTPNLLALSVLLFFIAPTAVLTRDIGLALPAAMFIWAVALTVRVENKQLPTKRFQILLMLPAFVSACLTIGIWNWWKRTNQIDIWADEFMNNYLSQFWMKNPKFPNLGQATPWDLVQRVADNTIQQTAYFSEILTHLGWISPLWYSPAVLLPLVCLVWGLLTRLRQSVGPIESYFICYMAIVLLWPFPERGRFLIPVFPFAVYYFGEGAARAFSWIAKQRDKHSLVTVVFSLTMLVSTLAYCLGKPLHPGRQTLLSLGFWSLCSLTTVLLRSNKKLGFPRTIIARQILAAIVVTLAAVGILKELRAAEANRERGARDIYHAPTVDASEWISKNTDTEDVVMASEDGIVHYITKRRALSFPALSDSRKLLNIINNNRVKYLVVRLGEKHPYFMPTEETRLESLLQANIDGFNRVFAKKGVEIYRIGQD